MHEYFAYDPTPSPLAPATRERLFGWRRDPLSGRMTPLWPNKDGFLWSEELASYLVPDEQLLRLADHNRQLRLTEAEAQAAAKLPRGEPRPKLRNCGRWELIPVTSEQRAGWP